MSEKRYIEKQSDVKPGLFIRSDSMGFNGVVYQIDDYKDDKDTGVCRVFEQTIDGESWICTNPNIPFEFSDLLAEMFYIDDLFGEDEEEPPEEKEDKKEKPDNPCQCSAFYGSFPTVKESHSEWCDMYKDDFFREDKYKQWRKEYKIWEKNNC